MGKLRHKDMIWCAKVPRLVMGKAGRRNQIVLTLGTILKHWRKGHWRSGKVGSWGPWWAPGKLPKPHAGTNTNELPFHSIILLMTKSLLPVLNSAPHIRSASSRSYCLFWAVFDIQLVYWWPVLVKKTVHKNIPSSDSFASFLHWIIRRHTLAKYFQVLDSFPLSLRKEVKENIWADPWSTL